MKNKSEVEKAFEILMRNAESDFEKFWIRNLQEDLKNPPRVEIIDEKHQKFKGKIYSKQKNEDYGKNIKLHRIVWQYYNGEIPAGDYQVHHKSIDRDDNQIENLQLLTNSEHQILHNQLRMSEFICEECGKIFVAPDVKNNRFCSVKCREIHQHRKDTVIKQCEYCGEEFASVKKDHKRFCSPHCAMKARYADNPEVGNYYEIRICSFCGKEFSVYKYDKTRFCSMKCAMRDRRKDQRLTKICPICGKGFETSKSADKICCSRKCSSELKHQKHLQNKVD